jgi:glycosyltransferase involved in cell wall biosynthesis
MRVALVVPRFPPDVGGVESHVYELARHFVRKGMTVEILTQAVRETRSPSPPQEPVGCVVRRFPVINRSDNYAISLSLPLFVGRNRHRYDLLHLHQYHALPALGAALLAGDLPVVFTPHYHGVGHSRAATLLHKPYRHLGRLLFARSDQIICVSDAEADLVMRHFPGAVGKVVTIPNGVETSDLLAAEPFEVAGPVVLSVGRLESYKNVAAVIGVMAQLDDSYTLRIAGDGPERVRLQSLAADMRLGSRVEFLGRIDRATLCRWYRTAAVFVSASSQEAFGISALEALASGAAVVLSDIPAHREIVERYAQGRGHLVCQPCTPSQLSEGIVSVTRCPSQQLPAPALPSWESVADQTARLYESTLDRTLRRAPLRHNRRS